MNVLANCPVCQEQVRSEFSSAPAVVRCAHCQWSRGVDEHDVVEGRPLRCIACGCDDLWRQKDFPVGLGMALVVLGAVLFATAMAYYLPYHAIGILLAFAAADLVLFKFMPDVLVCYRCHARHRRVPEANEGPQFQLETFERYRQEGIRLKQAGQKHPPST